MRHLADELGLKGSLRVAIQGFGNAGQHIAQLLAADGHKIVAVSDSDGAVQAADGLDLDRLLRRQGQRPVRSPPPPARPAMSCSTADAPGRRRLRHAGAGGAGEHDHASTTPTAIKARVVLELANGPVTPEADAILDEAGVVVLPDILANAGGVTVSYFEWVQNRQGYLLADSRRSTTACAPSWSARAVPSGRSRRTSDVTVRTAAYVHALSRLAEAIEAHGTQSYFAS